MRDWGTSDCAGVSRVYDPSFWSSDQTGYLAVPASHNRWRVSVTPDATVTAGDVRVRPRVPYGDGADRYVDGLAATIAYSLQGAEATGSWAPGDGRQLRLELAGYVGAGNVVVQVETWREPW